MCSNTNTTAATGTSNAVEGDVNAYTVMGMTCSHCSASVTEEVTAIAGISNVAVDLETGTLTFASDEPVDPAAVRAAVEEAGYELRLPS